MPQEGSYKEAREALVELFKEYGAKNDDAVDIASKCPKYLELLMESVRELDEHSLWGSWAKDLAQEEEFSLSGMDFSKKVYLMANKKGDRGVLALLESIGLRYSSSIRVSGYISSCTTLPELIETVIKLLHFNAFLLLQIHSVLIS